MAIDESEKNTGDCLGKKKSSALHTARNFSSAVLFFNRNEQRTRQRARLVKVVEVGCSQDICPRRSRVTLTYTDHITLRLVEMTVSS